MGAGPSSARPTPRPLQRPAGRRRRGHAPAPARRPRPMRNGPPHRTSRRRGARGRNPQTRRRWLEASQTPSAPTVTDTAAERHRWTSSAARSGGRATDRPLTAALPPPHWASPGCSRDGRRTARVRVPDHGHPCGHGKRGPRAAAPCCWSRRHSRRRGWRRPPAAVQRLPGQWPRGWPGRPRRAGPRPGPRLRTRHFVRVAPSCPRRTRSEPRPHPGRREPAPRCVVRDGGDERDRDVRTGTEHGSEPGTARPVVDPLHVDDGRRRVRTQPLVEPTASRSRRTSPTTTMFAGLTTSSVRARASSMDRAGEDAVHGRAERVDDDEVDLLDGGRRPAGTAMALSAIAASGFGAGPVSAQTVSPTSWARLAACSTLLLVPLVDKRMTMSPGRPCASTCRANTSSPP